MRNIVLCCDGTGNEYGAINSNVVKLYSLLQKDANQLAFYDPGVGTGGWEYSAQNLRGAWDKASGAGVQKNVQDAYRYLMRHYRADDRIYLFGFSRGAFTARSLAGMLHKVGLLRGDLDNMVEYAGKLYNTADNAALAASFKTVFARPCPVYFIGVWDTVASLRANAGDRFHDHALNPAVCFGYHAVSIDEKRKDFPPCLWDESGKTPAQTIEQLWFPGAHSDVGGGYEACGLADGALQWMARKALACGVRLDRRTLMRQHRANPHCEQHDESRKALWRARGSRRRRIPESAKLHRSVSERMERSEHHYRPQLPADYEVVD